MNLAQYLCGREISDAQFAALIGVDRSTVTRLRGGNQIPSPKVMAEIVRATDGEVTANDFFSAKPDTEQASAA